MKPPDKHQDTSVVTPTQSTPSAVLSAIAIPDNVIILDTQTVSVSALALPSVVSSSTSTTNSPLAVGTQTVAISQTVTPHSIPLVLTISDTHIQAIIGAGMSSTSIIKLSASSVTIPMPTGTVDGRPSKSTGVSPIPIILDGTTYAPDSNPAYVVLGQTLTPGGTIALDGGTSATIARLDANSAGASVLILESSTSVLQTPAAIFVAPVVVDGTTYSANVVSAYLISGRTLTRGGSITLGSGSTATSVLLSTNSAGESILVVGSSVWTILRLTPTPMPTLPSGEPVVVGGTTYTATPASAYLVSGQSLTLDGSLTLHSGTLSAICSTRNEQRRKSRTRNRLWDIDNATNTHQHRRRAHRGRRSNICRKLRLRVCHGRQDAHAWRRRDAGKWSYDDGRGSHD